MTLGFISLVLAFVVIMTAIVVAVHFDWIGLYKPDALKNIRRRIEAEADKEGGP